MKAIILRSILALLLLPAAALGATLQSIEVQDYQVEFVIEGPFSYTIYKPEPFRALLELRDVRPGPYGGSLAFEARGSQRAEHKHSGGPHRGGTPAAGAPGA